MLYAYNSSAIFTSSYSLSSEVFFDCATKLMSVLSCRFLNPLAITLKSFISTHLHVYYMLIFVFNQVFCSKISIWRIFALFTTKKSSYQNFPATKLLYNFYLPSAFSISSISSFSCLVPPFKKNSSILDRITRYLLPSKTARYPMWFSAMRLMDFWPILKYCEASLIVIMNLCL